MRTSTISQRLKLLISIFFVAMTIAAITIGNHLLIQLQRAQHLQSQISAIRQTADIIHNLQVERGLSSGFLGSGGKRFMPELSKQRRSLSHKLIAIVPDGKNPDSLSIEMLTTKLQQLRDRVDRQEPSAVQAFDAYTRLINSIRADYVRQVMIVHHITMRNHLQAYGNLMAIKEAMGQMRGAMTAVTAKQNIDQTLYLRIAHAKAEFDIVQERFRIMAIPQKRDAYNSLAIKPEFLYTIQTVSDFLSRPDSVRHINPSEWFHTSTIAIESVYALEKIYFQTFDTIVTQEVQKSKRALIYGILLLFGLFIILLLLGQKITQSIEKTVKLLDEYKHAVDRSSIVSKTTPKGVITYVNEPFCTISGYTREELIGQNHNIVRHPDMSQEIFASIWESIGNKRPWNGILKNRKKDGSSYWVNATINPILDNNDDIEEIIAIRNDITQTIHLHEELEKTQQDMIIRIGEIGETRSRETGYHVRRVAEYSRILATKYGLKINDIRNLTNASPMHDIGKIGIPDAILQKAGPLEPEEWTIMRTHSEIGYNFFKESDSPLLKAAAIITYEHHEKYDGSGYPRGLKGEDIHIFGRITAVADVFDALGSERCYKKAWPNEEIYEYFQKERGKHFDPVLIDLFFKHLGEFLAIQSRYSEIEA
ncbi:MAG: HD domain-containing phosphohydrolase [Sulfuricurvum sp.]|uniref:HD domain-containing phosphohydrolase n=1 Tax=Sulfuricurvum sp. TaxID=2025608 RepID=UPI0035675D7E